MCCLCWRYFTAQFITLNFTTNHNDNLMVWPLLSHILFDFLFGIFKYDINDEISISNLCKGTYHEGGICWGHVTNSSIWGRFYHRIELVHFEEHSDIWFVLTFVKMSLMLHVRLVWRTGGHVILEKNYFYEYLIFSSHYWHPLLANN